MQAFRISTTDGTDVELEVIELPDEPNECYQALADLTEGPVECVQLSAGAVAVVNEQGLYHLPRNPAATLFVTTAVVEDGRTLIGDIHGTAVVLGHNAGKFCSVTHRELNRLVALASIMAAATPIIGG